MAKINVERADELIAQTIERYPKGEKSKFMLKQIFDSLRNSFGKNEKQFIMKANTLVLKHKLDMNYGIPLFRTGLTKKDIR